MYQERETRDQEPARRSDARRSRRMTRDENGRIISERIALSDALTTLAELHKIVYARKSSPAIKREDDSAAGQADLQ